VFFYLSLSRSLINFSYLDICRQRALFWFAFKHPLHANTNGNAPSHGLQHAPAARHTHLLPAVRAALVNQRRSGPRQSDQVPAAPLRHRRDVEGYPALLRGFQVERGEAETRHCVRTDFSSWMLGGSGKKRQNVVISINMEMFRPCESSRIISSTSVLPTCICHLRQKQLPIFYRPSYK